MKLVDLSLTMYTGMYRVESHPELDLEIKQARTVEGGGSNVLRICFGNHIGTHVDGPKHLIAGGESIDELPLESFYGTGVVLNLPKGPDQGISPADLAAARPAVKKGDIVLLCTGWGAKSGTPDYPLHHAYLTEDGAKWLIDEGVRMVGIDAPSHDLPHSLRKADFKYTTLFTLLKHRVLVIHNLVNLETVAARRLNIMAIPIKFRGVDGSPARVVAQID